MPRARIRSFYLTKPKRGRGQRSLIGELWQAQQGLCFHCGGEMVRRCRNPSIADRRWSREHLYPRSTTGKGVENNIVLAHRSCNAARGDRAPTPYEVERARVIYAALGLTAFVGLDHPGDVTEMVPPPPVATLRDLWPALAPLPPGTDPNYFPEPPNPAAGGREAA